MARQRKVKHAKPESRYVSSLDGLRALCALGVIGYHMRLPWLGGGLLGVTVLFVLSGYLVTAGLMREFSKTRGTIRLGSFWIRRFWRLMPTVILFIAVTGALCSMFSAELFTKMRPDIVPALFMFINWSKILANESYFAAAGAPSPLTHFWSLAIEAQFYLIWPPVLYLLMRKRVSRKKVRLVVLVLAAISAMLMALLYVPGGDPTRSYYGTDTRAMSLLLGCWLAIIWPFDRMSGRNANRLKGFARIVVQVIGPLCVLGLVAMMVLTEGYTSFSYYGGILLCSVIAVVAIAALVPAGGWMSRVLSLPPLEWLGKRSYAIYLWHYPILELMNPLKATTGIPWWKLLLELAIILAVSEVSYRLVEVPFRSLGKPVKSRDGGKHPALRALSLVPAVAITIIGCVIMVRGFNTVPEVTVTGEHPDEKRVMQASLRKPLQDGVYDVVFIGDSVSLGANEQLNEAFPHGMIDTRGERQAEEALAVLNGYLEQGVVGDDVVISIGTNGVLSKDTLNAFLEAVEPKRNLWYVNLRSPNAKDIDNNELISSFAQSHENVHLIDWNSASEGNDGWLIEDGIHLTWDGRDAYAKLVVDTMGYEVPDASNTTYNVMVFGDTVCLDAADQLATAYPHGLIDVADGRKPDTIADAYKGYADKKVAGSTVVVCVGSEDELKEEDLNSIVKTVGEDTDLWFVNVRTPQPWESANNDLLNKIAGENKNVSVIDWYGASKDKDDWLQEDKMHLSQNGAEAYADLIVSKVKPKEASSEDKSTAEDENTGSSSSSDAKGASSSKSEDTYSSDSGGSMSSRESSDESAFSYESTSSYSSDTSSGGGDSSTGSNTESNAANSTNTVTSNS